MEAKQQDFIIEKIPNVGPINNRLTWIETQDGTYLPSVKYDTNIKEDDGEAFNGIEWRKLKLAKSKLTKVKIESLKPSD